MRSSKSGAFDAGKPNLASGGAGLSFSASLALGLLLGDLSLSPHVRSTSFDGVDLHQQPQQGESNRREYRPGDMRGSEHGPHADHPVQALRILPFVMLLLSRTLRARHSTKR